MEYPEKIFKIDHLEGISEKQIEEHLKLYSGYVKHTNLIFEKIATLSKDPDNNAYVISELRRRFGFEFNGMRMHEYYFEEFVEGPKEADKDSELSKILSEKYGSVNSAMEYMEDVALTRGIGWMVLCYDSIAKTPYVVWVGDHELGQLGGLSVIMVLDMWEHAFMVDYTPSEKKKYIRSFFNNLNWKVPENRFRGIM
ncbi:Fe-Mn family superoxide dismutase [Patescibacteria group bacterium]|nr:Fe-Mn family superoxide dismutase [Patescibacteria group bacterium]